MRRADPGAPAVELVVLIAATNLGAPLLREAAAVAVDHGATGVRERVYLTRTEDGQLRVAEFHDGSDGSAFGPQLMASSCAASSLDATLVGGDIGIGGLAAVHIVDAGGWPHRATRAVRRLGVTVHQVRLPAGTVADVLARPT